MTATSLPYAEAGTPSGHTPWPLRPGGFVVLMLLLQAVHVLVRPILTPTIGTDDVDQLFFAQTLAAGYSYEQGPLYTWILWFVLQLLPPGPLAVGLVKYGLVFLIHLFTYLAARQVLRDPRLQVIVGLAPMTLYPIGWRLHEADTYSVLASVCAMAMLWAAFWLVRERRLAGYLALGLALGAGLCSSGYFGPTALALLLCLLAAAEGRRVLLHWGLPLALAIGALVALPYGLWILDQGPAFWDRFAEALGWLRPPERQEPWFLGLWRVVESITIVLFPAFLIFPVIFFYAMRPLPRGTVAGSVFGRILWTYAVLANLVFMAAVVALDIQGFNPFRVYPAIIPFVLLFFWRVEAFGPRPVSLRWTWIFFAILVVVVVQARFQQVQAGPAYCKVCRMQAPYPELAALLRQDGYEGGGTLLGGDVYVAGNMRVAFPDTRVLTPRFPEVVPPPGAGTGPCVVVWHEDMRGGDRRRFDQYLEEQGIVLPPEESLPLHIIEVPQTHRISMPNRVISMRYVISPTPLGSCG